MNEMTRLDSHKKDFAKKRDEALTKFKSLKQNFRKREKKIRTDLEKASKIWGKLGQRFKWWQSLP